VFGGLARRGLEAVISAFALLGFCCVPLGKHTALEHAKSIFSTPAAERALAELASTFARVRTKLNLELSQFGSTLSTTGAPAGSSAERGKGAAPEHSRHAVEPIPHPPHLGSDTNSHGL
jgi:hypothetical protein